LKGSNRLNTSKDNENSGIHFPIEGDYIVTLIPKETEFKLKERIYEYFFDFVFPFMEKEEQDAIDWDREHSIERKEEEYHVMQQWEEYMNLEFGVSNRLPSWCLARLWYLTSGRIIDAVESIHEENRGAVDGGSLYISVLIEKDTIPVAVLTLNGDADSGYLSLEMRDWSPTLSLLESQKIFQSFSKWILSDGKQIAVCKIIISNPEWKGFPWEYGYDGKNFLRLGQESVLHWYDSLEHKRLAELIRQAIVLLEKHPLHHLEQSIRNEIINELTDHMIAVQTDHSFWFQRSKQFGLELSTMEKAAGIWKAVWPEEKKIDEMLQTCRMLVYATTVEEREQLMENIDEYWNYINNWIQNTWIRGSDHKRNYYSAGLAGVCIVKGMKEINTKIKRFDQFSLDEEDAQELYYEDMYFYAACATADGVPYEMDGYQLGKKEKFEEYWKWWLLEAIPMSL
jgi:hypothetical protein